MSIDGNGLKGIRVGLCGFAYGHQTNYGACLLREAGVTGIGASPAPHATPQEVASAREAAARLGVPFFASLEEMLDQGKPDFVSLAVHPAYNPEAVEAVAGRKIAILSEKPLAFDAEGLERIRKAVKESGVYFALAVAAAKHARPVAQVLKQFHDGAIGKPRVAYYQFLQSKGPLYATPADSPFPIGEIDIFGPYAFLFLNEIFGGKPTRIYAVKGAYFYPWYRKLGIHDLGVVHVEYEGGGVASIVLGRTTTKCIPNTDGRIEVIGDAGALHVDSLNFNRIIGYHGNGAPEHALQWHETDSNFAQFYIRDVMAAYRSGTKAPVDFDEAVLSQECVFQVTQK